MPDEFKLIPEVLIDIEIVIIDFSLRKFDSYDKDRVCAAAIYFDCL